MSVVDFLNAVLPTQGYRFALSSFGVNGQPDFKPGQRHFAPGATQDMLDYVAAHTATNNSFFAVGGFSGATLNQYGKPRRVAEDAMWHRCLRLDIDIGPGKDYTDRRTALTDLLAMQAKYAMPQPWIVDSGGGYHVYWSFDRDASLSEWLGWAGQLVEACLQAGLKVDGTTTVDAARILRIPGTPNNKPAYLASGNPPIVTIIQTGHSVPPEQIVAQLPAASLRLHTPGAAKATSAFQQGAHEPYFLGPMLKACPGLTAMVLDGGARAQEPLWKKVLDLINKSDDTEELKWRVAQGVSVGHRSYDPGAFTAKWQLVQEQGYHPPRCTAMATAGMTECATCPYNGKISSPLVLGRPSAGPATGSAVLQPPVASAAVPPAVAMTPSPGATPSQQPAAAPSQPAVQVGVFMIDTSSKVRVVDGKITPYLLIAGGYPTQVVSTEPDENGVRKQYNRHMIDYPLLAVERMLDRSGERSVVVLTFDRGHDGLAEIEFDNGDFAEPRKFFNKMIAQGLYCNRKQGADFVDKFMVDFLTSLQRARAASQISGRCGWSEDLKSFVLGTQVYRDNGTVEHIRTSIAPGEMEGYHSAGNEADWRAAFDICLAGGPDRQAIIALSLAGPLMAFTGLDGIVLNAYSPESGVGKSTLCDAAISIWGSPSVLTKDFRDTANATFKLASVSGNMPMVIDEFTNIEGKALSDYVYTVTQGREKHRLTSDAKLNAGGSQRWCLPVITTANNSVHEKLQAYRPDSTAEAARVFEMRLHPLRIDPSQMGQIKEKLTAMRRSYGFLGPRVVSLFLSKPPSYWQSQVMQRIAKWDREASASAGDRFRSATCALIEIGALLGKAMGFAFDPAGIEQQLRAHWVKQVNEFVSGQKQPVDFLRDYVLRNGSDITVRGGLDGKAIINVTGPRRFAGETKGVTGPNGKWEGHEVLIPSGLLRDYVREQGGNYKTVAEWLEMENNPMVVRHGMLEVLSGTVNAMRVHAYSLKHDLVTGTAQPVLSVVSTEEKRNEQQNV